MSWQADLRQEFSLNQAQIVALESLLKLLTSISDRNLTAVTGSGRIIDVHFRDSLSLLAHRELEAATAVVDIGSGGGFPGLPLAIARSEKNFLLIEANSRKSDFLASSVKALRLANVRVLALRAEDAGRSELRESFDLALARAVGPLPVVLEYALPLLATGGAALLQRGARADGDSVTATQVSARLGGKLESIAPVCSYPGAKNLHIWLFRKVSPTPEMYPRRPGMPKKRPLGL